MTTPSTPQTKSRLPWQLLLVLEAILLAPQAAVAEYEGVAFGVNDQICGGDDLSYGTTAATSFYDGLGDISYDQRRLNTDAGVDASDFTDNNAFPTWGGDDYDPYGTDFADVMFVSTHGEAWESPYFFSRIDAGDWVSGQTPAQVCQPRTARNYNATPPSAAYHHMRFGNGGDNEELNVAYFNACQVLQYSLYAAHGMFDLDAGGTGAELAMVAGFHGYANVGYWEAHSFDGYVSGAENDGIGDDWVDQYTDIGGGSNDDDCAVVIVYGSLDAYKDAMFYNGGFKDFRETGLHSSSDYWRISGCDPDGGPSL